MQKPCEGRIGGRATKPKIDAIGVVLVLLLAGLAIAAGVVALRLGWFRSIWEFAGWLVVCAAFIAVAVSTSTGPVVPNSQVHGDARVASEDEAKAAARGDKQEPELHDRRFRD